jgi:hypothetical protein
MYRYFLAKMFTSQVYESDLSQIGSSCQVRNWSSYRRGFRLNRQGLTAFPPTMSGTVEKAGAGQCASSGLQEEIHVTAHHRKIQLLGEVAT